MAELTRGVGWAADVMLELELGVQFQGRNNILAQHVYGPQPPQSRI